MSPRSTTWRWVAALAKLTPQLRRGAVVDADQVAVTLTHNGTRSVLLGLRRHGHGAA
jgi:hypothetical protein